MANTTPPQPSSNPETHELPLVTSGSVLSSADATTQGQVASALQHVSGYEVQTASSGGCTLITNSHTGSSTATQLAAITSTLIQSSLQPSSIPTYRRACKLYSQFDSAVFQSSLVRLPISPSNLGFFIAYMFQHQYAASTANTNVSALGYYCHRLAGVHDPTKVFWMIEMLKGYGKLGSRVDTRLPITLLILRNIIHQTFVLCSSQYRAYLLCVPQHFLPFYGLVKLPFAPGPRSPTVFQLDQVVQLADHTGNITGLKITFANFKHSYNKPNVSITLNRRSDICPVQSLLDYFACRGLPAGPLFRTQDGHAVSRKLFTDHLALVFRVCGLDSSKY